MNLDYLATNGRRVAVGPGTNTCVVCPLRSEKIGNGIIYYRFLLPLKASPEEEFASGLNVPLLVITGPGQTGMDSVLPFAVELIRLVAQHLRIHVLVWDRRNMGLSDINYEVPEGMVLVEQEAEDLHVLLSKLKRRRNVFLLGMSSGARLCLLFNKLHPRLCNGLILAPPTGGKTNNAIEILCESYYEQYVRAALNGGMEAVKDLPFYRNRTKDNLKRLLTTDVERFVKVMQDTCKYFRSFKNAPLIGLTDSEAQNFRTPLLVVHSGDTKDQLHLLSDAQEAARLIPTSNPLVIAPRLIELRPFLVDFLKRNASPRPRV